MDFDLQQGFCLRDREARPEECTIRDAEGEHHVEPRVMDVLVALAESRGRTVSRQDLIARVWPTDCVTDEVLSRCISLLRRTLRDDPRSPRFIETIPKRGYRLIAPVSALQGGRMEDDSGAALAASAALADVTGKDEAPALRRQRPLWRWALIGALLLAAGLYLWLRVFDERRNYDSIAVVRFSSNGEDQSLNYLGSGVAEEILNLLAQVPGLKVVGKVSAFRELEEGADIPAIAAALDVDTVLQGSISQSGDALRIWVQLSNRDSVNLWSETYHQPLQDVFLVQDRIARAVVDKLRLSKLFEQRVEASLARAHPAPNPDAHLLYLRGIAQWDRRSEASIRESMRLFGRAAEIDPGYPQPHLGLARAWAVLPFYSNEPKEHAFRRAEASARHALSLDPSQGTAHTTLGFIAMHRWHWAAAAEAFEQALVSRPNDATTHQWYSQFLANTGFFDKSFEQALIAADLEPRSSAVRERLGTTYLWLRNDENAEREFLNASRFGYSQGAIMEPYILLLWRQRRMAEIDAILQNLAQNLGLDPRGVTLIVRALDQPALAEEAFRVIEAAGIEKAFPPALIFGAAVLTGQHDYAFKLAEPLIEQKRLSVEFLLSQELRVFRQDPRFPALLARIGLPAFWRQTAFPTVCSQPGERIECD